MIYALRTTAGRENMVIDMINANVKSNSLDIKSIVHPGELRGYIFLEGDREVIKKATYGVIHVKGLIEKPVKIEEIKYLFEEKKKTISINKGDIVEIIGGPFKGEKGKIERIDEVKDEITVELLEASIPIPVTISLELVRLVKKAGAGK